VTEPGTRAVRVLAITAGVVLLTPLMLAMAIMKAPEGPADSPLWVVTRMDAAAAANNWKQAHAAMDFDAKAESLLPDLWAAAGPEHRAEFVRFLQTLYRSTWERGHGSDAFKAGTTLTKMALSPDHALVEQIGFDAKGEDFVFRYWMRRGADGWRIIDRTTRTRGVNNESSGIVKVIRKRIAGQLGHPPSLHEFTVNAPSWLRRVKLRTIKVGDLTE